MIAKIPVLFALCYEQKPFDSTHVRLANNPHRLAVRRFSFVLHLFLQHPTKLHIIIIVIIIEIFLEVAQVASSHFTAVISAPFDINCHEDYKYDCDNYNRVGN